MPRSVNIYIEYQHNTIVDTVYSPEPVTHFSATTNQYTALIRRYSIRNLPAARTHTEIEHNRSQNAQRKEKQINKTNKQTNKPTGQTEKKRKEKKRKEK